MGKRLSCVNEHGPSPASNKTRKNDLALLPYSPNINQDLFCALFGKTQKQCHVYVCCSLGRDSTGETTHVIHVAPAPAIVFSRFLH